MTDPSPLPNELFAKNAMSECDFRALSRTTRALCIMFMNVGNVEVLRASSRRCNANRSHRIQR